MTLFTKTDCRLCEQIKDRFDLAALDVHIEVLDGGDPAALAHLAWHGLVETARKSLPILVLDDCSSVAEYDRIESLLMERAKEKGVLPQASINLAADAACADGSCSL